MKNSKHEIREERVEVRGAMLTVESALHIHKIVERDGEIEIDGLPYRRGQHIEMVLRVERRRGRRVACGTARDLRRSRLVGMWQDRADIGDSLEYSRRLRQQAQEQRYER
jgi:hypothetical protein